LHLLHVAVAVAGHRADAGDLHVGIRGLSYERSPFGPAAYFTGLARGFAVELGTPSLATLEALRASIPAPDPWPPSDTFACHDWHFGGNGDIASFMSALAVINTSRSARTGAGGATGSPIGVRPAGRARDRRQAHLGRPDAQTPVAGLLRRPLPDAPPGGRRGAIPPACTGERPRYSVKRQTAPSLLGSKSTS
jgi:hypothetical protein